MVAGSGPAADQSSTTASDPSTAVLFHLPLWLGKGVDAAPGAALCPGKMQVHFPWSQQELHVAAAVLSSSSDTLGGEPCPLLLVGSPETEEEGQGASKSISPCESSCCPPASVLQRKGVSSSFCKCQTPRTASATWDAPGPGTRSPGKHRRPAGTLGPSQVAAE